MFIPLMYTYIYLVWMRKGDFFLPFTVGTPTTAAQPPFQPQYVYDYVLFTYISTFYMMWSKFTF